MKRLREERRVLIMFFLTDLVVYWVALSLVTAARLETLAQVDFVLIRRDRLVCLALFALISMMMGAYHPSRITDRFDAVYYSVGSVFFTGLAGLVLASVIPAELRVLSRREMILSVFAGGILLGAWRYFAASLGSRFRLFHRYFYVLGSREKAERIAKEISRHPRAGARYIDLTVLKEKVGHRKKELGSEYFAHEVAVITLARADHNQLQEMLDFCQENFRRTFLHPSLNDVLLFQHKNLTAVAGVPLIEVASAQMLSPYLYVKRLMDIVASALGLLALAPVCSVTAIAIKLSSPGRVLYVQERLGKGGRPFKIYKFRSMMDGIELKDENGHVLAKKDDSRITPVGRFIRKHRIDEIPQLFNVLRGDMSLIGPRPAWTEYYESNARELPLIEQRLAVRPGLTCLSHVLGSYFSQPEDRLCYDLVYISTLSLMSDLRVIIGTIRIVLSGKGAA